MHNFYDEMIFRLGMSPEETVGKRVTIFDMRGVVVEGHNGVSSVKENEIVLRYKREKLRIIGQNLSIAEFGGDEVFIKGRIISVGVDDGQNKD